LNKTEIWITKNDIKDVIRSRKPKNNRQCNGQVKYDKMMNNDLQNITQKTKDRATRTPLQTADELMCCGRI